ncbi:hypothetical protein [Maribellus sp. YY47]|uniref:hypothetical protein n=1 Tax=Maribellus sp. YY47 TaxID=2929486 RepID=UPI002000E27C|nr:hypothetical protein [Maribellus sp. YY47]MCK3684108.1 hypothetical protein [Maribellus sp. YY47]
MAYEISIFLENKIGHFKRVTTVLKENKINIRSIFINDTANGWGILNLLVDQPEKAYEVLSEKSISVALREVIALEMKDETGGLDDLLLQVAQAGVNFNNAAGRIIEATGRAILILDVPDYEETIEKLKKQGLKILDDSTVYGRQNESN